MPHSRNDTGKKYAGQNKKAEEFQTASLRRENNFSMISVNYEAEKFTVWLSKNTLKDKEFLRPEDLNFSVS
ncbi:MAG: hypothetical protein KGJ58_00725 [Patescibacteria group bacterium]|nr:hypothetical protein [Patescibacteria group bacterium]MDE2217967.1 hypothetical protein [Patescibacteria group bacterium]